ncbi:MAG: M20/M25/M40 family metallo-hydrolase [Kofleriaceae bacterium]|nr:M20/M25/M40 family metallo-hydrolase [Kofleriaceae bacterium]
MSVMPQGTGPVPPGPDPSSLRAAVDARLPAALTALASWVEINSFTGNVGGCDQVADALLAAFALPGLGLERRAGVGGGDHVVVTTPAWHTPGARRLLLVGHHDTVFPPGTFTGYRVDPDGVRARGPGVLDMKGGLAVIWAALAALSDLGLLAALPLALVSVADEETGSVDSSRLTEELARGAAAALVFEAGRSNDALVVRRKGTGKLTVDAVGRAAHAGNDLAAGRNAIVALAELVLAAHALARPDQGLTVNAGLISGGTSANTVPAAASCQFDLRFVASADGRAWIDAVRARAAEISARTEVGLTLSGGVRRWALECSPASEALAEAYGGCARAEGLGAGLAPLAGGGSDANTVAAVGVPVIDGLGPRGRGFHTHDEYIELTTVGQRARALARFLAAWAP